MNNSSKYVSIWVGHCQSEGDLDAYVAPSFSDDGDMINSQFAEDYKIDHVDDDFLEHDFFGYVDDLSDGIDGFSYSEQICPQLKDVNINFIKDGVNFAILYYNFEYAENIINLVSGDISVEFLGCYEYI